MSIELDKPFEEMTDEERLEFAMRVRHDVIRIFTHNSDGSKVESMGEKEATAVKGLLKDIDGSIYTKKRLSVDEATAESDMAIAEAAERILERLPMVTRDKGDLPEVVPEVSAKDLPDFDITEEMVSDVGSDFDFDQLMEEQRKKAKGED